MKLMMFLCLPMLTLCSANLDRKESQFHHELNTVVGDLIKTSDWVRQKEILATIDIVLLGGSKLEQTHYRLADITQTISRDKLEEEAQKNRWIGILRLFGNREFVIKKEKK